MIRVAGNGYLGVIFFRQEKTTRRSDITTPRQRHSNETAAKPCLQCPAVSTKDARTDSTSNILVRVMLTASVIK